MADPYGGSDEQGFGTVLVTIYFANPRFRVPCFLLPRSTVPAAPGKKYPTQTLRLQSLLFFAHTDTHRPLEIYFSNPCFQGTSIPQPRPAIPRRIYPGNESYPLQGSPGFIETQTRARGMIPGLRLSGITGFDRRFP